MAHETFGGVVCVVMLLPLSLLFNSLGIHQMLILMLGAEHIDANQVSEVMGLLIEFHSSAVSCTRVLAGCELHGSLL